MRAGRRQLQIVVRNFKPRSSTDSPSNTVVCCRRPSKSSTLRARRSALSPTLSALLPQLQLLEAREPLAVEALANLVAKRLAGNAHEVASSADTGS